MNKKIAVIASYIHPIRQRHLLDWYEDLSNEPINSKLFLGSKSSEISFAENYKINTKREKLKYSFSNIFKQKIQLKNIQPLINYNPDIIHLLTSNAFENIEPLLENSNIKLIVSFRGYDINVFPQQSELNKELTQRLFKKADILHFVSEDLKNRALDLNADPDKCKVINRSIRIKPNENNEILKPDNDKIIIVSVGRLVWEKGYLYALETISYLKKNGYNIEYHIVGDGIDRSSLMYHVNRLDIIDCVLFLGELTQDEVNSTLFNSDIYFQPSVIEGIPNTIFEASYFKLPIISSNVGGIPEVIEHGFTGFLSSACKPEEYAKNIVKLLENKENRIQMGLNAYNNIIKNFGRDNEIEKWKELYNSFKF